MYPNNSSNRRLFLLPLTSVCALCVGLALPAFGQDASSNSAPETPAGEEAGVNTTDYDLIEIAVQDADLAQVLQMLSLQSRRNIITSKNVSATVSANLYDVTFNEALDAILSVNGFKYVEKGNFIYVYTQQEFEAIETANRKMVSRIFELDHLSATDAIEFITPLLSENGKASARGAVEDGFKPDESNGGADTYSFNVKVVVNDFPENLDEVANLLNELDSQPQQVLVEATILQTAVNEANAFGIDFNVIGGLDFADIVEPLGAVTSLLKGSEAGGFQPGDNEAQGIQSTVGNTQGPGGLKIGVISNDISVFLRVLDEVTDSTVLARPKVMALNRQRAEVLVGARVGYLSTTATETTTTQTVEFLDTGVQLIFRPFISKDGTIRMELKPSVSEASLRTVTDSNGALVTIPDELTREMTTNVRVRDGQTLVLGGLFRESTKVNRRQVPLLGDIPILGAVFQGQDDAVDRSEIIFLITPTITHDEHLTAQGDAAMAMAELARIGARNGLLPFSREKMTAAYNNHAMDAATAGDTDLALFHIHNSLRLNASQPELLALRQRLTGDAEAKYERSLMERVLNRRMETAAPQSNADAVRNTTVDPLTSINAVASAPQASNQQSTPASSESNPAGAEAADSNASEPVEIVIQPISSEENEAVDNSIESFINVQLEERNSTKPQASKPQANAPKSTEFAQSSNPALFSNDFEDGWTLAGNSLFFGSWWYTPALCGVEAESNHATVTVSMENAAVADVLEEIASQTGRQVVAGSDVKGQITIHLKQASFSDALDAVVSATGLGFREINGVFYVFASSDEVGGQNRRSNGGTTVAGAEADEND
jgi:type IV pilus assembly protein PilQ